MAQFKGLDLGNLLPEPASGRPAMQSILVGWDAADWDVMDPLLAAGKLPNVATLLHEGHKAKLATLDPPISPMLWTSIATGNWPSVHGIHGFTELHEGTPRAVRSTSVKVPSYWHYLEDQGIPALVVAWWPSHPSEPSTLGAPRISNLAAGEAGQWIAEGILPSSLQAAAEALMLGPEDLPSSLVAPMFPGLEISSEDDIVRSVLKVLVHALNVHTLATLALDYSPGGHASIYYDALDHFKHVGMRYAPPQLPTVSDEDFTKYQHIVEGAYRLHDLFLGALLDGITDHCHVLLISDHGFTSGTDRLWSLPEHAGAPALEHKFYGVFAARGPKFATMDRISGLSLLDIFPMLLAIHELKAPEHLPGKLPMNWPSGDLVAVREPHRARAEEKASNPALEQEMLDQLDALGYLDLANTATRGGRIAENLYYLARSLRYEGKIAESYDTLLPLLKGPEVPERYAQLGASILASRKLWAELEDFLKTHRPPSSPAVIWDYFDQLVRLSKGQPLELPERLFHGVSSGVAVLWGQLLVRANAMSDLHKLLQTQRSTAPDILNLWLRYYLYEQRWEEALDAALQSTEQLYHQPFVHRALALVFEKLGMQDHARTARSVAGVMLPKPSVGAPLVIVTGPPRSGTSLAMQILEAAGIAPVTDGIREADQSNARGYYEHERIKHWDFDPEWLQAQRGKAIKIVEPLLVHAPLPHIPIVVIRMDRSLDAITRSQRKMKGAEEQPLALDEFDRWRKAKADWQTMAALNDHIVAVQWSYESVAKFGRTGELDAELATALKQVEEALGIVVDKSTIGKVFDQGLQHF